MIFTRYLFRNLLLVTLFTAVTLAGIVMLTQSIRFLELIVESGASGWAFWLVTFLALPRFFEVILPLALTISIIFLYNRMNADSELVVARAAGLSPLQLARPALLLAGVTVVLMVWITGWLAPSSVSSMQQVRGVLKAQYSTLLFREGVFNSAGKDITVYIRDRAPSGELNGLMIHDTRNPDNPVTILAKRGIILSGDEGQQVLVYDGTRQDINPRNGALNNLQFQRYTIDLPDGGPVRERAQEAKERTLGELIALRADGAQRRDARLSAEREIWRRVGMPFLSLTFTMVALAFMVLGPVNRRGQSKRIVSALLAIILLQAAYIGLTDAAQKSYTGIAALYAVIFGPIVCGLFMMSRWGERLRHRVLYRGGPAPQEAQA